MVNATIVESVLRNFVAPRLAKACGDRVDVIVTEHQALDDSHGSLLVMIRFGWGQIADYYKVLHANFLRRAVDDQLADVLMHLYFDALDHLDRATAPAA